MESVARYRIAPSRGNALNMERSSTNRPITKFTNPLMMKCPDANEIDSNLDAYFPNTTKCSAQNREPNNSSESPCCTSNLPEVESRNAPNPAIATATRSTRCGRSRKPIHNKNGVKTAYKLVRKLALATFVYNKPTCCSAVAINKIAPAANIHFH